MLKKCNGHNFFSVLSKSEIVHVLEDVYHYEYYKVVTPISHLNP